MEQLLPLLADIGCGNVGIHYDTYHACLEEADLLASLETALKSGRVTHFHACANNRGAPGDGIVPWDAVMQLLKQYGYAGHITMETFAPGGWTPAGSTYTAPPMRLPCAVCIFCNAIFKGGFLPWMKL